MSTLARYTHIPLPSSNHIRLLEFPAYTDQNEPLQGTIRVVDLEESTVPYVALSYTWGQPNFSENLLLDGNRILGITPTLAAALRRFRYSSALRWIWVDAICINQQDNAEKTVQIPLMGDIYRGASRVMIWLGDRAQDVDLLHRIKRLVGRNTGPHEDDKTASCLVTSMSQLGRLPWFGRRWIIQELVLNPNAVLCCDQIEMPWLQFFPALQAIENEKLADLQNIRLLWDLWRDISLPMGTQDGDMGTQDEDMDPLADHDILGKRDMAALMHSCSAFECLDRRDLIAALIGLSTDASRSIAVNYADTVEQTFISFAEGLARSGHMAWLIYQSLQRKKNPSNQGRTLPSWVPDWRLAISMNDRNSKLDTEIYERIPCDVQMYSANSNLHLLTAKFSILSGNTASSDEALQVPFTGNVDPAPLQVEWKSVLFSKDADSVERMALTLVDLWPWVVSHLSEQEMAFKKDIWFGWLIWLSYFLLYPPPTPISILRHQIHAGADHPAIPDFVQDANGLNTLRSFISDWVNEIGQIGQNRSEDELARIDCLIICRQNGQSGFFSRDLPCAIGSLQLPFYDAVEIGDKVLMADLGQFHFFYWGGPSVQRACRHIVREHPAVDDLPVLSGAQSLDNLWVANECASREELSEVRESQENPSPIVYEFVAPCDLFSLFPRCGLHQCESEEDTRNDFAGIGLSHIRYNYDIVQTISKKLSIWVK